MGPGGRAGAGMGEGGVLAMSGWLSGPGLGSGRQTGLYDTQQKKWYSG